MATVRGAFRGRRRLIAGPLAILGVVAVVFSLLASLGGVSGGATPSVSTNPQVIAAGQQLFDLHCSSCHGVNGVGTFRAPSLVQAGAAAADFYLSTGRMPLNATNDEPISNRPFFNQGQIQQLTSYVADLPAINGVAATGPGIPTILPLCTGSAADNPESVQVAQQKGTSTCVTLSFGQRTFALNCAQCHQIAGSGGLLSGADVIPSVQNATLVQVGEAIRVGPGAMPRFGPGQLSEVEVSALAHYAVYLQRPKHPGGARISGFGPVAEGFVGIVVGLGLLLVISRLMGTRS